MKNPSKENFELAYKKLNTEQREAVDTIEGPVMVIAGPGTGKTQILAIRIANILQKTDVKPENILALTFTDSGAHAMRERLRRYIGDSAYHTAVHTFHSFAGQLIGKYPDAYPNIIGGRPANDIEKISILQNIIDSGDFHILRPSGDPLYYVKKIPGAISDLKKDYISPDELSRRIGILEEELKDEPEFHSKGAYKGKRRGAYTEKEKRISKLRALAQVYRLYQSELHSQHLFDFEDMITETVSALENNEDMLLDLQETYQYILADEHQDVNESQNKILQFLSNYHEQPNLFVVGDEKQAIYRFQGASLENFLFFEKHFPNPKVISLTDNYRSTQDILDTSHSLIETSNEELAKLRIPLKATRTFDSSGAVEQRQFTHEAVEDEWVVSKIKEEISNGVPLSEIAIIVRHNKTVEHFASLLRKHGIDVNPSAESDILDHPVTLAVESLLRATWQLDDEGALFDTLCGGWWNIPAGDLARIFATRSGSWSLRRLIENEEKLLELKIENPTAIIQMAEILKEARNKATTGTPSLVMQYLIEESGFLNFVMQEDPIEGVRVLRRLYDDVEAMSVTNRAVTLSALIQQLNYRRSHNLSLQAPLIGHDKSAVNIMTAHKSKGLEFHTVIIPRAHDNSFGGGGKRDYFKLPLLTHKPLEIFESEDDDRRLLYVAMTRAQMNLYLSWSDTNNEDKLFEPSRFLSQMGDKKFPLISTVKESDEFKPETLLTTKHHKLKLDPTLIREIFLSRGFSVTHLNNYLENPLKYYEENLLRRPHPRGLSLLKGEAVHEVLDLVVSAYKKNPQTPTPTELSRWLKHALSKLPLSLVDETQIHEAGLTALVVYTPHLVSNLKVTARSEMSISATLKTGDLDMPEVPLTGKLDRLDFDEEGNILNVIDYKTGKPKSRNEIAGLTKNSNGSYKRQLVFYALLLKMYYGEQTKVPTFTLSFVEPKSSSGEVVEYSFEITNEEIENLKQEIIRVSKEICGGEKFL